MSATPTTTPGRGSLGAETSVARAWRWLREHAVNIVAVLVLVYLLIPIVLIFVFSFNNPAGPLQLHLGRLHAEALGPSIPRHRTDQGVAGKHQAGPAGDGDLDDHRHDDGDRPGPP
jgi:hypothetical protein